MPQRRPLAQRSVVRNDFGIVLEWRSMKAVVFFLALLAVLKVGTQEYMFRSSTEDVIVAAYRDRATLACQKDPKSLSHGIAPVAWEKPAGVKVVIGKSNLAVYFWQIDHEMWNARYRNPYLFLFPRGQTPGPAVMTSLQRGGQGSDPGQRAGNVFCEYDIVNGAAAVFRM